MDKETSERFQRVAEQALVSHLHAYTEHSKWILASLLALNGGALIAIGQILNIYPSVTNSYAPVMFVLGAAVAVLSGILARKQTIVVAEAFMGFLAASTDETRMSALELARSREKCLALLSDLSAYMSGVAFLAGAFFTWMVMIPKP